MNFFTQPPAGFGFGMTPQNAMAFGDISQFGRPQSIAEMSPGLYQADAAGTNTLQTGGLFGNTGLGMNLPTLQFGLGAAGSLASLFNGFQANRLARDQFNFTRDTTNTNLNNSIKSYNTALSDRAYARAAQEGRSSDEAAAYVDRNRLTR